MLPHKMVARNILYSDIISYLKEQENVEITIISGDKFSDGRIKYQPICRPFKKRNFRYLWSDCKLLMVYILQMMVAYRFNSIKGFTGFKMRIRSSRGLFPRWNEGHALSNWFGFPFAKSLFLYDLLKKILNSSWARHKFVREQFNDIDPDKLFVVHLQIANIIPYIAEARARKIPIHGMIGSWDQPSTKGAICDGVEKILVCNERLKKELQEWHNIDAGIISVVGWPQMDIYYNSPAVSRLDFLTSINLKPEQKYILCGAYTARLGAHEIDIFEYIANAIETGILDSSLCLYIRSHPLDKNWENRFAPLKKYNCVIIEPPSIGNLEHLSQLLHHATVVMASAGTILLDAIAHDKSTIAMSYGSNELMRQDPHIEGRYEMEHLSALMESGAIIKATSDIMLIDSIKNIINNPELYKNERDFVRKNWLEPFDGKAAWRVADAICS